VASTLRFARNEGAVTLACSPSLSSQAARVADHLLYAPGETEGAMPSLTGLYALCTAIAQTLSQANAEALTKRASEIKHALSELA
jgi:DNA-binding MurR/RpiR family transcriptional regulator